MENINTPQTQGNLAFASNQTSQPLATANASTTTAIALPLFESPDDVLLAAKENALAGERFPFSKVKMPSGGGLSFELQDENGQAVPQPQLKGIILAFKGYKSWYEKSFDERDEDDSPFPDCFSADGITGTGCPRAGIPEGQKCVTCPKGQWASSRRGGKGKDCSDRVRTWILLEGYAVPVVLDLPKTSLQNFKQYRKRLTDKAKVYYGVVTVVGLEKDKSTTGKIEYSKATFAKAADLSVQERNWVKQYIDANVQSFTVERESVSADPTDHVDALPDIDQVVKNMTNQPY